MKKDGDRMKRDGDFKRRKMKKDRDAAEQKNAEQLEKIKKNCQDHDDDETTRSKLSVHFETTTSEVVLQKQQLSVQDELMNKRARTVINRVTLADRDNYATVKEQLLKEFKLTPREYRSKFMDAKKTAEETYTRCSQRD